MSKNVVSMTNYKTIIANDINLYIYIYIFIEFQCILFAPNDAFYSLYYKDLSRNNKLVVGVICLA